MYVLILTMVLQLQEPGTKVEVLTQRVENIESRKFCDEGAKAWEEALRYAAVEPQTDYEAPDDEPTKVQPREDRFRLLTPVAVCVQQR